MQLRARFDSQADKGWFSGLVVAPRLIKRTSYKLLDTAEGLNQWRALVSTILNFRAS
jgi:hypothetical protein